MSPSRGEFVGRQPEKAALWSALEDALAGHGRLVMVVGEPGIGKTRIAHELTAHAETLGVQPLWGRCPEERGAPPYWAWTQLITAYAAGRDPDTLRSEMGNGATFMAEVVPELKSKLPDLGPPPALGPEQARFSLFHSVATFFKTASKSRPLVIVLDDLHWADASSLRLLEFFAHELAQARILVLGTYRDSEVVPGHPLFHTLGELTRQASFHRVPLRGLGREEVGQIIRATGGVVPPQELVTMVHWQTDGNPLFVSEVVRLLAQQGMFALERLEELSSWTFVLPEGIREVISRRFERLPSEARQVLSAASVIGREFDLVLLGRLCRDLGEEQLLESLDEALRAHVIEELPEKGGSYRFTHVLMQQTLYEDLPASRRARMHAAVGEAMEEAYSVELEAHAAEVAHHFAASRQAASAEKLARYSTMAGEQALAFYAWDEALAHFERSLGAMKGQPMTAQKAEALFGLGRAQAALARFEEAWASLGSALEFYLDASDVAGAVAVAEYPLPYVPGLAGMTLRIEKALRLVPEESIERGRLLSRYGRLLNLEKGDYAGAQRALSEALEIARREQDRTLEMRVLTDAADVEWHHLQWLPLLDKSLGAVELAQRLNDPYAQVWPRFLAGFALTVVGRGREAQSHASTAMTLAERLRDRDLIIRAAHIGDIVFHSLGKFESARDFTGRGLAAAPDYPNLLGLQAVLECEQGNVDAGQACVQRLLRGMRASQPAANAEYAYTALVPPLIACIAGGDQWLDIAEHAANTTVSFPSATLLYRYPVRIGLALIAVMRNDSSMAAEQYKALASQQGTSFILVISVDRVLGLLARTLARPGDAEGHFEKALDFCRRSGYRPELAWTCHDYAQMLCQRGDRDAIQRASALLKEGLDISRELGMKPLATRLEMLEEGLKRQASARPTYPDGLTGREVEVLRLIAAGKSNQAIAEELVISLSTVAHHVSSIFNKTGVSNRAEAATYAARNRLVSF